jgi:hypothetical protein
MKTKPTQEEPPKNLHAGNASLASPIQTRATVPSVGDTDPPQSPVDMMYNAFAGVFGNSNPMQLFSLVWPGTILDYAPYQIPASHTGPLPTTVEVAQSILFDQYYPVAPITQPDGTKVSDRYKQALEAYGPIPNESLLDLQRVIRQRLDQKTTIDINGVLTQVTLLEKFSILQERWIEKKQQWAKLKSDTFDRFKTQGDADWWDEYIEWYEHNAEGYIEGITAAYSRMVADFPLNEFEDALAILDTHDAAALLRAKQALRNSAIPLPPEIGDRFFATQAVPSDWGNVLKPSTNFTDLLASPEAQQRYLDLCIEQLNMQVFAWNAVLAQIPLISKDSITTALNEFQVASNAYYEATSNLIKTYTDNTVLAVKTYLQYKQGSDEQKMAGANELAKKLSLENGKQNKPVTDWSKVAEDVGAAQKKLIDDTASMVKSGQRLAETASAYLKTKAGEGLRELIIPVLSKLQAQLDIVVRQIQNLDSSAGRTVVLNSKPNGLAGGVKDDSQFSSVADALDNQRWTEVTFTIKTSDMSTQSETSTSFSQTNWNVDLFFGSAGGQDRSASEQFASKFMDAESEIQVGMLATKVLIERPWMHPEIFTMTKNYFKAVNMVVTNNSAVTRGALLSHALGGNTTLAEAEKNCTALNQGVFPAYPVALLLVKDVTIKLKAKIDKTEALQAHSERTVNNGGGFLCFSVSKAEASTSDTKAINSYAMAGDYVFRIPAPQIIGVWNQILPQDQSSFLDPETLERILKFQVSPSTVRAYGSIRPHVEKKPVQPK